MTSRSGVLLGTSAAGTKQPRHPDTARWIVSLVGFAMTLIGFWGAPVAWWLIRLEPRIEQHVYGRLDVLSLIHKGLYYAAWCCLGCTVAGGIWALYSYVRWRCQLRYVQGQYFQLVIPRPQGTRESSPRTNPQAPYLFWDRLIAILQATRRSKMPPYLSAELWGDESGRVQWGIWLPDHVAQQRDPIRRLMTAERPQARLVEAPDPVLAGLQQRPDDADDRGTRWYADVELTLRTADMYPLLEDMLGQRSLVAGLRPPRAVLASGISVIVTPAPLAWARRVHQLVQRRRWNSRFKRRFDDEYGHETDVISLKAQQAHARVSVRVHVVAQTKAAAQEECRSLVTILAASRKRYASTSQHWQSRGMRVVVVRGRELPVGGRVRAPFRALPRLIGIFPFM